MRPIHRWSVVAGGFVVLALVPMAGRAFPATDRPVSAAQLLRVGRGGAGPPGPDGTAPEPGPPRRVRAVLRDGRGERPARPPVPGSVHRSGRPLRRPDP